MGLAIGNNPLQCSCGWLAGLEDPSIQAARRMQSSSKSVEPTVSPDRVYSPLELSGRAPSPLMKVASDCMDQGFDRVLNCLGGQKVQCNGTSIEIQSMSPLAEAMCAYAVNHSAPRSLRATKSIASKGIDGGPVQVNLGLGETEVMWEGQSLLLTHQALGKPHWSGGRFSTVVLSSTLEGSDVRESMLRLLAHALQEYETAKASHVTLFSFNAKSGYWQRDREIRKRELESIILPPAALATIVEDARRFLTEDAQEWYGKHGVPYKRTYCLHGPPGCGKTSLVSAVASEFDANVCMLSLADPDLKDSGLRAAMQHVPKRSVIVFEDVDAVFNHHREKTEHTCLVTFSGLLNALDGVGEPSVSPLLISCAHISRANLAERLRCARLLLATAGR